MRTLKITLLMALLSFAISAGGQEITVNIIENTGFTELYEVKLYVIDTYTQNECLVAQKKNVTIIGYLFGSTEINLTCVNLVKDQIDRYRYIAYVARQTASGSGVNWTPLLDTGEMWGDYSIYVTLN